MSLLREIQEALMKPGEDLGPILLKFRYLASRLGSAPLEDWVRHESEGYPTDAEVPDYRKVKPSYKGTFSGPFGSGIKNAPIPSYLIDKYAGDGWLTLKVRQSISEIDSLISVSKENGGHLGIECSNLILVLQGKIYEDYACNSINGSVASTSLSGIQGAVRTRMLELTIELEKSIPSAAEITLGPVSTPSPANVEKASQIINNVIHGNVTNISNVGDGAQFNVNFEKHDSEGLIDALVRGGIPKSDATEFAQIVASEEPTSATEPFGTKAKGWLKKNIGKAVDGTWKAGLAVATDVLTEAALKYYGLK